MVPVSGELALDVRRDIIRAVELHMKATGLSQSDVAEAVGQSPTYVNNVLTESPSIPPATRDRILRDLNNWLEREARAREAQRPDDFVRTRVAERLIALAERLTERADMAIAFGPAGIGKTTTAQAIAAEIRTAVLVTAGYDTRTPKMLVNQLYLAVSRRGRPRGRITLESVIERLRMPSRVHTRCPSIRAASAAAAAALASCCKYRTCACVCERDPHVRQLFGRIPKPASCKSAIPKDLRPRERAQAPPSPPSHSRAP